MEFITELESVHLSEGLCVSGAGSVVYVEILGHSLAIQVLSPLPRLSDSSISLRGTHNQHFKASSQKSRNGITNRKALVEHRMMMSY